MNFNNNQNYFSYHQPAQSYGLGQEARATEMPMPYGGSALPGTQFPQGMPNMPSATPPMQNPYGGSALPGTGMPDISNYPSGNNELPVPLPAQPDFMQMGMTSGLGAQSQDPSQGIGMMQLKSMANRTGQEPYQNFMPQIAGYRLPRGI